MLKKVAPFYAFGFFFSFAAFIFLIIFNLKIDILSDIVFLSLIGLTCSFPIVVIVSFLSKPTWVTKRFITPPVKRKLIVLFLLFLVAIGGAGLLIRVFWRPGKIVISDQRPTSPTGQPTSVEKEAEGKMPFQELSFPLKSSLVFVRYNPLDQSEDLFLTILAGGEEGKAHIYWYAYDQENRTWQNKEPQESPREYLFYQGKPVLLLRPGGFWFEYDSVHDSLIDLGRKRESGYEKECAKVDDTREVCFEKRSVYFGPLKTRQYPWDGRFNDDYSQGGEKEILTFDYADLTIYWDDPNHYCGDDCFSTHLVGYFDNYQKALLALESETTSRWGGEDDSGWLGFYVVDLVKKTLKPFQIADFGRDKIAQREPYLEFSDLNLFVYRQDKSHLAVKNLLTGQKRTFSIIDPVQPEADWRIVDLKSIKDRYLYLQGDWDWTMYFKRYYDLVTFKELKEEEVPPYVLHPDGYWNSDQSQYAWEDEKDEETVFIYDEETGRTETLLDRDLTKFDEFYQLGGWGAPSYGLKN